MHQKLREACFFLILQTIRKNQLIAGPNSGSPLSKDGQLKVKGFRRELVQCKNVDNLVD